MKDIRNSLIKLLRKGYCTPQISSLAKTLKVPSATLHYNLKNLEKEGIIKKYSAVLDHKKAGQGFCSFILINLDSNEYGDPEKIAKELASHEEVESVDICTGDWELLAKVRTKNIDEYYEFAKKSIFQKRNKKSQISKLFKTSKKRIYLTVTTPFYHNYF